MIPARWAIAAPPDPSVTTALAVDLSIPEPLAALLVQRGFAVPELAKSFLRPHLDRLSDPSAWADMVRATALVVAAVRAGTPILVHGDYDVDGQCAAALLTRVLRAAGGQAHGFVPHRLRDAYDFGAPGAVAQPAAAFPRLRRARHGRRRGAARGREPHPGASRAQDARGLPLDRAAGAGGSGWPRREAVAGRARRLYPRAPAQRRRP